MSPILTLVYTVLGVLGSGAVLYGIVMLARAVAKQATLTAYEKANEAQASRISALEGDRDDLRASVTRLQTERTQDKALIDRLTQRIAQLEAQIAVLQSQATTDAKTILHLTQERDGLRRQVRQLTARVKELERLVKTDEDPHAAL